MFNYSKDIIVEAYKELKYSCSNYSGNDQLFKVGVESSSLTAKDTELFYCQIARLLFASKRTRLDIQTCLTSLFTRVELLIHYYKDIHMDIGLLFINKI